jgi:tRNA U34 5-methylaminomethyl-2-thiouridine-forming methyltransferase MnmC
MKRESKAFEIVSVKSGVRSLRCLGTGEIFHPVVGPMIEARTLHVGQQRLLERAAACQNRPFVIWDVGLGAAANAIAVLEAFENRPSGLPPVRVELHSFDQTREPLEFALSHAQELGYILPHAAAVAALLEEAASGLVKDSAAPLRWRFHEGDFREMMKPGAAPLPMPDAILYDPYSAKKNPGMWSLDHFKNVRARLEIGTPCMLSNYTRSTAVRVTLLLAGFYVGHGEGVGEKDQTTVASNEPGLLDSPLDARWLERVRFSTKGAPLREGVAEGPISAEDWAALLAHPQFAGCSQPGGLPAELCPGG